MVTFFSVTVVNGHLQYGDSDKMSYFNPNNSQDNSNERGKFEGPPEAQAL